MLVKDEKLPLSSLTNFEAVVTSTLRQTVLSREL